MRRIYLITISILFILLTPALLIGQEDSTKVLTMPQTSVHQDGDKNAEDEYTNDQSDKHSEHLNADESTARKYYFNGEYSEAARVFETILDKSSEPSAALYFNLGTSLLQAKQYGKAILMLERAKRLDPKDKEIINNLNLAYSKTIDDFTPNQPFISYISDQISGCFGLAWSITLAIVFTIITVGGIIIFFIGTTRQKRRIAFYVAGTVFFLMIISNLMAWNQYSHYNDHSMAIVQAIQVEAKENGNKGKTEMIIHEGTKVKILETKDNLIKVQTIDQSEGWIPASSVQRINPLPKDN